MVLKFKVFFYCSFTNENFSKLRGFKRNILPLFQSYKSINHGVEKKFQMPVFSILGLG